MENAQRTDQGAPQSDWGSLRDFLNIEPEPDPNAPVVVQATRIIAVLNRVDQRVKGLEEEAKDAAAFYALQLEKAANNRAFVESQLSHLVKHHPDNKIVTPKGTAFFSSSTRRTWPEDAELLSWAQTNIPAAVTKKDGPVSVSKKDILEAFKAGTVTPPAGFREEKVTKLSLRAFATPAPGTENEELKPIIHVAQTGEGSW